MNPGKTFFAALLVVSISAPSIASSRYVIRGIPHIMQEPYLCAAASCAMVLNYYRYKVSQQEIALCDIKNIEKEIGIDSQKIISYLRSQGLRGELLYSDLKKLRHFVEEDMPVIVITWADMDKKNTHARVVMGFDNEKGTVIYIDPSDGKEHELKNEAFSKLWEISGTPDKNCMIVVYP